MLWFFQPHFIFLVFYWSQVWVGVSHWVKLFKKSNIWGEKTHKPLLLRFWVEDSVMLSYKGLLMTYIFQISSVSPLRKTQQSSIRVVDLSDQLSEECFCSRDRHNQCERSSYLREFWSQVWVEVLCGVKLC